jgi:hypothetical protein
MSAGRQSAAVTPPPLKQKTFGFGNIINYKLQQLSNYNLDRASGNTFSDLMLVKLTRKITNRVVDPIGIFLHQYRTSSNGASIHL